ncbi:hypothetical protein EX30DRAFT_394698 [Ascodesmis nigricans]|uniref:TPR-like protein n=1 Tax=Ascodesmis nigricans TaxID=341454 RepID=A0A4S2N054_9PEZI|nr:hypothetical protein EX30DRAFT_394698 [Ascodesmis nigricans]
MPRPQRRFHTNSKKHKKVPETADDFLAAGIEYEESGDRWRPGDKLKAGRFYVRAIEAYQACLVRDPQAFDAAYNKARLHYQLAEQPNLLPNPTKELILRLLETALQEHHECLTMNPQNDDTIFNTAQVHTSLAEFWIDSGQQTHIQQIRGHFSSAIDMFQKCLASQQQQYDQFAGFGDLVPPPQVSSSSSQPMPDDSMDVDVDSEDEDTGGVSLGHHHGRQLPEESSESATSPPTEYAHVVEPVTISTLLDTTMALIHVYTLAFPHVFDQSELASTSATVEALLKERLEPLSKSLPERESDVCLALALLRCAQSEGQYRTAVSSLADWSQTIASCSWPSPATTSSLSAKADAHTSISLAALEAIPPDQMMAWKHYSFASASLGEATKLEATKAELYLARGDTDLMRSRLDGVEAAVKSRAVLRKNAGVYYRGAMKLGEGKIKIEGDVKDRMIKYEDGDETALVGLDERVARDVVADAVEEGVFGAEWMGRIGGGMDVGSDA